MRKALLSLFLIGVVAFSGCVGQEGRREGAEAGLIIKDFSFDYAPIYSEEEVGLTLEVQNIGGDMATLKKIMIFGPDLKPEAGPLSWGIKEDPEGGQESQLSLEEELAPPDPATGFEGDSWFGIWQLEAPTGVTSTSTYDFEVRVEYDYFTTFTGTIRVMEYDYLRSLSAEERESLITSGGIISSDYTSGPIAVEAVSGRHFIVYEDDGKERTVKFRITNIGVGYPYKDEQGDHKIMLSYVTGREYMKCEEGKILTLSRGESGILSCTFKPPPRFDNKIDVQFSIEFDYNYYIDESTIITVEPGFAPIRERGCTRDEDCREREECVEGKCEPLDFSAAACNEPWAAGWECIRDPDETCTDKHWGCSEVHSDYRCCPTTAGCAKGCREAISQSFHAMNEPAGVDENYFGIGICKSSIEHAGSEEEIFGRMGGSGGCSSGNCYCLTCNEHCLEQGYSGGGCVDECIEGLHEKSGGYVCGRWDGNDIVSVDKDCCCFLA